jgi:hypothetical protein
MKYVIKNSGGLKRMITTTLVMLGRVAKYTITEEADNLILIFGEEDKNKVDKILKYLKVVMINNDDKNE